ncbi:unnamed protein product [Rhizophagus irregularis]|nr:unnamed protein product [Rhizophagus irregularis]
MYFLKKGEQDRLSFESIFISLYIIAERREKVILFLLHFCFFFCFVFFLKKKTVFIREILQEIFNYLDIGHGGLSSLSSCLLVDQHWSCLDEETREDLRNNGVNLPVIFNKPFFSYEMYHKHLHYRTFISCVYLWVQEKSAPNDDNLFELIMKTLLKLFNESCNNLQRTLYIMTELNPMFYVQSVQGYLISNVNRIWVDLHMPRFLISLQRIVKEWNNLAFYERCCYSLDGLAACNNLEILRFKKCYNITADIVSPLFEASFPKIN